MRLHPSNGSQTISKLGVLVSLKVHVLPWKVTSRSRATTRQRLSLATFADLNELSARLTF